MRNLLRFLLVLFCLPAFGAGVERIAVTVTITNVPVTSNTLTINATTRTWTNLSSSAYILTNLVNINYSTTNLANNLASFPLSGPMTFEWLGTNSFRLRAPIGGALAASSVGNWCTLTLSTQSAVQTFAALWPMENLPGELSNRTNQASSFVSGLGIYSTNAFPTNSTAVSNHLTKGASPQQYVASPVQFNGTLRAGGAVALTNGFTSATTNINPVSSNLVNYGNAIRSEGTGGNSFQVGSNAQALGSFSTAVGNSSIAEGTRSIALGYGSFATNTDSFAIGTGAIAFTNNATAIGVSAYARGDQSLALGYGTDADINAVAIGPEVVAGYQAMAIGGSATAYRSATLGFGATSAKTNSTAIGTSATTTTTNQIRLGTASDFVSIPGVLEVSGTQTNTTFTGTNVVNGRMDFKPRSNTSLANGYNSAVILGTNVYIRFSGPSAAYTNVGFASAQDGTYHIAQFDNPGLSFTLLDSSGLDVTPANRILTGTGALLNSTNNPAVFQLLYDGSVSRWRVLSFR